jgi:hypothetical protein
MNRREKDDRKESTMLFRFSEIPIPSRRAPLTAFIRAGIFSIVLNQAWKISIKNPPSNDEGFISSKVNGEIYLAIIIFFVSTNFPSTKRE